MARDYLRVIIGLDIYDRYRSKAQYIKYKQIQEQVLCLSAFENVTNSNDHYI